MKTLNDNAYLELKLKQEMSNFTFAPLALSFEKGVLIEG